MDVRQDAAAGDGDGAQELVELLVVADGELDVARDERSIAALWRVARARGGRGRLLVGLEDAGTRGGVTRRVTKCDVLELKRPRGKTLVQSAVPKRSKPLSANSAFALV